LSFGLFFATFLRLHENDLYQGVFIFLGVLSGNVAVVFDTGHTGWAMALKSILPGAVILAGVLSRVFHQVLGFYRETG
jgi:hypothetical protein